MNKVIKVLNDLKGGFAAATLIDAKPSAVALVLTAEARTDDKPRAIEFTRIAEARSRKIPRSGVKEEKLA